MNENTIKKVLLLWYFPSLPYPKYREKETSKNHFILTTLAYPSFYMIFPSIFCAGQILSFMFLGKQKFILFS